MRLAVVVKGLGIGKLETKQLAALAIAPGIAAVALDVAIAHFAGREMAHPAQLLPVTIGPLAALLLGVVATARLPARTFRRGARALGGLVAALGMTGTAFHAHALLRLLQGTPLTWEGLTTALAVAPPLFAPGAFIGLGALVFLLGDPRLELRFGAPPARAATLNAQAMPAEPGLPRAA